MKKYLFTTLLLCVFTISQAQTYEALNYSYNGTPVNGVKIKTNIPFSNGTHMPTLKISGYNYGTAEPIDLTLVWYVYDNIFYNPGVSSSGAYTPEISLANELGKVIIFINDRSYYQRFNITAFSQGQSETSAWFQGWTVEDAPIQSGAYSLSVPYKNKFAGIVSINGNVLIGKTSQINNAYKLDVSGKIRADEITVNTSGADFVFEKGYKLRQLVDLEQFIDQNNHLPEIPSAKKMQKDGVGIGELQVKLLQKIEELTLYVIQQGKEIEALKKKIQD